MGVYSRYFEKRIDHKAEFKAAQDELDKENDMKGSDELTDITSF